MKSPEEKEEESFEFGEESEEFQRGVIPGPIIAAVIIFCIITILGMIICN